MEERRDISRGKERKKKEEDILLEASGSLKGFWQNVKLFGRS